VRERDGHLTAVQEPRGVLEVAELAVGEDAVVADQRVPVSVVEDRVDDRGADQLGEERVAVDAELAVFAARVAVVAGSTRGGWARTSSRKR
jgi:hypothetical protein